MNIARAGESDLQDILELQYLAYQSEAELCNCFDIHPLAQTMQGIRSEFERGVILKATNEEGRIIASVRGYFNSGTLYIGKLIVHPGFQGKGIGTLMLENMELLFSGKRYELFTSSKSERNIKLYERRGYAKFAEEELLNGLRMIYLEKSGEEINSGIGINLVEL